MNTSYVDLDHRSVADLIHMTYPPGWMITRINVPKKWRGQGVGSRLLDRICAEADKEGVTLYLEAVPSDGGLDIHALRAWYERRGFKVPPGRLLMARSPVVVMP